MSNSSRAFPARRRASCCIDGSMSASAMIALLSSILQPSSWTLAGMTTCKLQYFVLRKNQRRIQNVDEVKRYSCLYWQAECVSSNCGCCCSWHVNRISGLWSLASTQKFGICRSSHQFFDKWHLICGPVWTHPPGHSQVVPKFLGAGGVVSLHRADPTPLSVVDNGEDKSVECAWLVVI